jgi:hypothetical protein
VCGDGKARGAGARVASPAMTRLAAARPGITRPGITRPGMTRPGMTRPAMGRGQGGKPRHGKVRGGGTRDDEARDGKAAMARHATVRLAMAMMLAGLTFGGMSGSQSSIADVAALVGRPGALCRPSCSTATRRYRPSLQTRPGGRVYLDGAAGAALIRGFATPRAADVAPKGRAIERRFWHTAVAWRRRGEIVTDERARLCFNIGVVEGESSKARHDRPDRHDAPVHGWGTPRKRRAAKSSWLCRAVP